MWRRNVRIDYFFHEFRRFPWEIMGMTIPKVGSIHGYICTALSPYVPHNHREFFKGNPTLFELRRFAKEYGGIAEKIVTYSESYANTKMDTARIVLGFLKDSPEFRADFQKRIDSLYHQGLISIPDEAKPYGD